FSLLSFTDLSTTYIFTLSLHDALPILCIARNNERSTDNQLMQYVSVDGGENWDFYGNTNIPKDHWGTAPQLFYDKQKSLMIAMTDRKSTCLNSSHVSISYAVFCLKKKK